MKTLIKITALTLFLPLSVYANAEHEHTGDHSGCKHKDRGTNVAVQIKAEKTAIEKKAKQKVQKLLLAHKIPKSWETVQVSKMQRAKNKTNDWVVSFHNTHIENKSKQRLYIFVSDYGNVVGANYTGK